MHNGEVNSMSKQTAISSKSGEYNDGVQLKDVEL